MNCGKLVVTENIFFNLEGLKRILKDKMDKQKAVFDTVRNWITYTHCVLLLKTVLVYNCIFQFITISLKKMYENVLFGYLFFKKIEIFSKNKKKSFKRKFKFMRDQFVLFIGILYKYLDHFYIILIKQRSVYLKS